YVARQNALQIERELVHPRRVRQLIGERDRLPNTRRRPVGITHRLQQTVGKRIDEAAVWRSTPVKRSQKLTDLCIPKGIETRIRWGCPKQPVAAAEGHLVVERPGYADPRRELPLARVQHRGRVAAYSRIQ